MENALYNALSLCCNAFQRVVNVSQRFVNGTQRFANFPQRFANFPQRFAKNKTSTVCQLSTTERVVSKFLSMRANSSEAAEARTMHALCI